MRRKNAFVWKCAVFCVLALSDWSVAERSNALLRCRNENMNRWCQKWFLESIDQMADCINIKKKAAMDFTRSPWSSESAGSTSPQPAATAGSSRSRFKLDKANSGGSTCSLGSSPGTSFSSSLAVPDYNPSPTCQPTCQNPASPQPRSPSPFNIKARVRRRREKKLEKQANLACCLDDPVHQPGQPDPPLHVYQLSPQPQNLLHPLASPDHKPEKSNTFRFKDFRKRSKESLSFRRNKRHPTVDVGDNFLNINAHSAGTSPEARSPRSPVSPGQCKCRRCSLLPLEECEPKEVSALFKFLRKSKVCLCCADPMP